MPAQFFIFFPPLPASPAAVSHEVSLGSARLRDSTPGAALLQLEMAPALVSFIPNLLVLRPQRRGGWEWADCQTVIGKCVSDMRRCCKSWRTVYYFILFHFTLFFSISQSRHQTPQKKTAANVTAASLAIISRVLVEANKAVCRNYLHDLLGATSLITLIMSANLILPVSEQEAVLLRQIKVMEKEEKWWSRRW